MGGKLFKGPPGKILRSPLKWERPKEEQGFYQQDYQDNTQGNVSSVIRSKKTW